MDTQITDLFNKKLREYGAEEGIFGNDMAATMKDFQPKEITEDDDKRETSKDYLKNDISLEEIYKLAKNKKLSNNKIKQEIRKLLKNSEELDDFLRSFIKKSENKEEMDMGVGNYTGPVTGVVGTRNENKGETKEATASGGGVGAYEAPLFSDFKSDVKKVETKEATSTASSGAYEGPSIWAKTTSKKNWKPSRKTQIPGGKFVQVKKKCKRFPYCNQGDIKALNIFENEKLNKVIQEVSQKYDIHEEHIKDIILYELEKLNK